MFIVQTHSNDLAAIRPCDLEQRHQDAAAFSVDFKYLLIKKNEGQKVSPHNKRGAAVMVINLIKCKRSALKHGLALLSMSANEGFTIHLFWDAYPWQSLCSKGYH